MTDTQAHDLLRSAQALLQALWTKPDLDMDTLRLVDQLQADADKATGEQP